MIIDPQFRKCVTYLFRDYSDSNGEIKRRIPVATGFFVCVPLFGEIQAIYIVTARHVIRKSRPFGQLYIRFNLTDGTYSDFPAPQDKWIEHPNTDVALFYTMVPDNHDITYIPTSLFVSPKFISDQRIKEGDDVFFSGMFKGYIGQERMQPIIRFGNISLMPREKIPFKEDENSSPILIDAYLIEARSWGGHSGSPTFLYLNPARNPGQIVLSSGIPLFSLLGLVSSHFELPQDVKFGGDILGTGTVSMNSGLAIVIPAHYINEILSSEECVEQRRKIEDIIKNQSKKP